VNAARKPTEFWRSRLELPNYEVRESARYAKVHAATVSRWHKNTTLGGRDPGSKLSYLQLIELAVAAACKQAGMKLTDIRAARAYFAGAFKTDHPFATLQLKTDGVDLALQAGADLLIGNKRGQLAWNQIIGNRFKEFEYEDGLATKWHVAGNEAPILKTPGSALALPMWPACPPGCSKIAG